VPGDFMHLTPRFILDKAYSTRKWGPTGKYFVKTMKVPKIKH